MRGGLKKLVKGLVEAPTETSQKTWPCFKGQLQLYRVLQPNNRNLPKENTLFETYLKPQLPRAGGARPPACKHRCKPPSSTTLGEMQDEINPGSSYLQPSFASHTPGPRAVCSKAGPLRKRRQRTDKAAAIFGLCAEHVGNALRLQGREGRGGRGASQLGMDGYKVLFGKNTKGRLNAHHSPQIYLLETLLLKSQL